MKRIIVITLCLLLGAGALYARPKNHTYHGLPRTAEELMGGVLECLQYKDSLSYYNLFPGFDTLWHMVMHNPDQSPETVKELNALREHPQVLISFDPRYNHAIIDRFGKVVQKGEDSGIHWRSTTLQRFELREADMTRALIGYEKVAPERYNGYLFVRDMLGRTTFCIHVTEIQKIEGHYFGGQVINILEAADIDAFREKQKDEEAWLARQRELAVTDPVKDSLEAVRKDSIRNDSVYQIARKEFVADSIKEAGGTAPAPAAVPTMAAPVNNALSIQMDDDDKPQIRHQVIDRRYYEGMFDNEIPVKLFVRYMKDEKTGKAGYYDGLYKFGDQVRYVKLNITRTPEGRWQMEDDPPVGTMELELIGKVYSGSWSNNENQSGYDVVLTQKDIGDEKVIQLEKILDQGLGGRADDNTLPEKKKKAAKDDDDEERGNDKH